MINLFNRTRVKNFRRQERKLLINDYIAIRDFNIAKVLGNELHVNGEVYIFDTDKDANIAFGYLLKE